MRNFGRFLFAEQKSTISLSFIVHRSSLLKGRIYETSIANIEILSFFLPRMADGVFAVRSAHTHLGGRCGGARSLVHSPSYNLCAQLHYQPPACVQQKRKSGYIRNKVFRTSARVNDTGGRSHPSSFRGGGYRRSAHPYRSPRPRGYRLLRRVLFSAKILDIQG